MVNKCSAPGCSTGYKNDVPKGVSLFRFPRSPNLKSKWIRSIHRQDFTPGPSARICSKHFNENDFKTDRSDTNPRRRRRTISLCQARLKPGAVPSRFPNLPQYLTNEPVPHRDDAATSTRRLQLENERINSNIAKMKEEDKIESLEDLMTKFHASCSIPGSFTLYPSALKSHLIFTNADISDCSFNLRSHVVVRQDLSFSAYKENALCPEETYRTQMQYCRQIRSFADFMNLLAVLSSEESFSLLPHAISLLESCLENEDLDDESCKRISFLAEQLALVQKKPQNRRYSKETVVQSIILQSHSNSCYEALTKNKMLILPSPGSLRRITHGFHADSFDEMKQFLIMRRKSLNSYEATVTLMFDEIYVCDLVEYSSNKFYGLASNKNAPATTVLTFMIKSLAHKYREVVGMFPISGFTVDLLKDCFMRIMRLILEAGFDCLCAVSDNHPINRAFFKFLGGGNLVHRVNNPCDPTKDLFLLIDPTHCFKNIYNGFEKRVNIHMTATEDLPEVNANFTHVKQLFISERQMGLRMAHKLSERVLHPSNINRTSVKLASSVFHETTFTALKYHASDDDEKKHWSESATFIEMIHTLWSIINVKSQDIGMRKRDPNHLPISSPTDARLVLLHHYEKWFAASRFSSGKNKLTNETLSALVLMCQTLRHIVPKLLEKGFGFVLLGHLQSDPLEHRFGQYRQRSGSNYFLGIKQILETERKIKVRKIIDYKAMKLMSNLFC